MRISPAFARQSVLWDLIDLSCYPKRQHLKTRESPKEDASKSPVLLCQFHRCLSNFSWYGEEQLS